MASRSLNKVMLIGNLTRDPELRYTPNGAAVCTFGLATNRTWEVNGEKKDSVEFHNIVCWSKLAEICAEFLTKGKQAYVEGRLATREWEGQDGQKRRTTEIVADSVIFLGGGSASAGSNSGSSENLDIPDDFGASQETETQAEPVDVTEPKAKSKAKPVRQAQSESEESEESEDIPF